MTSSDATKLADSAAENAYVRLLARLAMVITVPVLGFLGWQVNADVSTIKQHITNMGAEIIKLDGRVTQAESRIIEQAATMTALGASRTNFQTEVVQRLTATEVEIKGLRDDMKLFRSDLNQLFQTILRERRAEDRGLTRMTR